MSRKYINKLLLLFISLSLFGCKDFIEKNISDETPVLILPANQDTIGANPVHIKWEELEGATKYRIEVVSPTFSNIQSYPLDSVVSGTNFYFGLDSAQYEIRITAVNAGFSSKPSSIKRFWVGTSAGNSNSQIPLINPLAGEYFNEDFDGKFEWGPPNSGNVSSFTFELHKTATFAGQQLDNAPQLNSVEVQSLDGTQLPDGVYCWGVKAFLTDGSEVNFSKRIFYIDKTVPPGFAAPTAPANNSTVINGSAFSWTVPADQGTIQSPRTSAIQIATDPAFTNIVQTVSNLTTNSANVQFSNGSGTYYWRVIVSDVAGNQGATPTTYFSVIIQ
ncbi:hypothetical protein D3C71_619520 [compost metagenome]